MRREGGQVPRPESARPRHARARAGDRDTRLAQSREGEDMPCAEMQSRTRACAQSRDDGRMPSPRTGRRRHAVARAGKSNACLAQRRRAGPVPAPRAGRANACPRLGRGGGGMPSATHTHDGWSNFFALLRGWPPLLPPRTAYWPRLALTGVIVPTVIVYGNG